MANVRGRVNRMEQAAAARHPATMEWIDWDTDSEGRVTGACFLRQHYARREGESLSVFKTRVLAEAEPGTLVVSWMPGSEAT